MGTRTHFRSSTSENINRHTFSEFNNSETVYATTSSDFEIRKVVFNYIIRNLTIGKLHMTEILGVENPKILAYS
jgi:hypothetical protein